MKISVSFLKSKNNLEKTIKEISNTDADYIHVDVMDGIFVPNTSNSYNEVESILKTTTKKLDVHLMVSNPINYITDFKNLKPEFITIHYEINKNLNDLIDLIHSYGIKAGISIKPKTSVESIMDYLPFVDNVLIMSVEPGLGGQSFMESVVYKIDILRKIRENNNYNYKISIDGGINDKTISKVKNIDFAISGSFICESDNYQNSIDKLRN